MMEPSAGESLRGEEDPARSISLATLCTGTRWLMERMTQYLSETAARFGMSSPTWKPGVAVAMGL